MNGTKFGKVAIFLILVTGVTFSFGGIAAADPSHNDTHTNTTTEEKPEEYEASVSENLHVVSINVEDSGNVTMVLKSEKFQKVTFTELLVADGFQDLNQKSMTLREGRYTVHFTVSNDYDQMGLTIASPDGIIGYKEEGSTFNWSQNYEGGQLLQMGVGGMLGGTLVAFAAVAYLTYRYANNVERRL